MSWLHRVLLICLRPTRHFDSYSQLTNQSMFYLSPPTWTRCSGIWICIILLILILAAKCRRFWRIRLLRTPVSTVSSTLWWFGWPRDASLIASDLATCCRSLWALVLTVLTSRFWWTLGLFWWLVSSAWSALFLSDVIFTAVSMAQMIFRFRFVFGLVAFLMAAFTCCRGGLLIAPRGFWVTEMTFLAI